MKKGYQLILPTTVRLSDGTYFLWTPEYIAPEDLDPEDLDV